MIHRLYSSERAMDAIRVAKVGSSGYIAKTKVDNVLLDRSTAASTSSRPNEERLKGTLHLTAHHLIFTGDGDELWVGSMSIKLIPDPVPIDFACESSPTDPPWDLTPPYQDSDV
jgi:hypothetical protein